MHLPSEIYYIIAQLVSDISTFSALSLFSKHRKDIMKNTTKLQSMLYQRNDVYLSYSEILKLQSEPQPQFTYPGNTPPLSTIYYER